MLPASEFKNLDAGGHRDKSPHSTISMSVILTLRKYIVDRTRAMDVIPQPLSRYIVDCLVGVLLNLVFAITRL